jgi:hypothetical protein
MDKMKLEERLFKQKQDYQIKNEQMRIIKLKDEVKENKEKPKIRQRSMDLASKRSPREGETKHLQLYHEAAKFNKNNKTDRKQDEIEISRKPDEYTFKPNSDKIRQKSPPGSATKSKPVLPPTNSAETDSA